MVIPSVSHNLYHNEITPPVWPVSHPLYWLSKAKADKNKAMLQLGIIYVRNKKYQQAFEWYRKAIAAGNQDAKEKHAILEKWLERHKEKSE